MPVERHPRIPFALSLSKGFSPASTRSARTDIHCAATVVVLALAGWLGVSALEWVALVLAIALAMGAEAMNTALEFMVDLASPEWHALARDAKDVAAAAVLVCSVGAAVVGLVLFVRYF